MGDQTSVSDPIDFEEPDDLEVFRNLEEELYEERRWRGLVRLYVEYGNEFAPDGVELEELVAQLTSIAEESDSQEETSEIYLSIGDVYVEELGEYQSAKEAYRTSFVNDTSNTRSLAKAREIYRREEKFDLVMKLYELEHQVAESNDVVSLILTRKAQVQGDYKGNLDVAEELVEDALALDPENLLAQRTAEIYKTGGTVEGAVEDTVRLAEDASSGGDEAMAARLFLKAGWLEWYREGGRRHRAREILGRAVDCDSDNEKVRSFHEQIQEVDDRTVVDSVVAEPSVVEVDETPEEDRGPEQEGGEAESEETESGSKQTASAGGRPEFEGGEDSIFGRVEPFGGDHDEAVDVWKEEPNDLSAFAVVRERLVEEEQWEELADALETTVNHLRKEEGEAELMRELARVHWKYLEDFERAEYYFKRLKLLDEEDAEIAKFYEEYYAENEQWRRLFSHLKNRAEEATSPDERRAYVERRASIAEEEMESPEKAIDVWRNYLRETGDPDARVELQRLFEEYEKWNGLVDFLKEEVRRLEEEGEETRDRRIDLLWRMVELYEEEIGHDAMALNALQRIVELDPDARGAFERLREKLEESRRWNDLVQLLEERAEGELDRGETERAVDTYVDVANVLEEELTHVARAVEYLERALEVAPGRDAIRERLASMYGSKRDYEALYELRLDELEMYEGEERLRRLYDVLELVRDKMRDRERVIPLLEEIVELDPDNLDAYEQLEEAYRRRESWAELRELLVGKAALLDGEGRIAAYEEAANLQDEHFEDVDGSIAAWEEVLAEDADHERAVDRLISLYVRKEDFESLEQICRERGEYERLFEILDDAAVELESVELQRELYRTMAELAEEKLEDRDRALASLEQLYEVTDQPREVARELVKRYREVGDLDRQVEMTRVVLEHTEEETERRAILERLSELEERRGSYADALSWQIEAVELAPERTSAVDRAEGLAAETGDFATLVELLEAVAEDLEDEKTQVEFWRRLGRLEQTELGRAEDAIEHLEAVRAQHPEDVEVLERLGDLYEEVGAHERLVEVLRRLVEVRDEEEEADRQRDQVDTLSRLAEVQWRYLGQMEAAWETYEEILEVDPDHLGAIRGLARFHRERENWEKVVEYLERELSLLSTDAVDRRLEAQFELAEVYRIERSQYEPALHHYREILDLEPDDEGAVAGVRALLEHPEVAREAALLVAPIFRETGRWEELAEAMVARLNVADDDFERLEILDELVALYRDELRDEEVAFERAIQQFQIEPEQPDVQQRLEELAASLGSWEDIERLFASEAPANEEEATEARCMLLRRVARIRRTQLDDPEGAVGALELLYRWSRDDDEVASSLESLYRHLERHGDLVEILRDRARFAESDEEQLAKLEEAATLYDEVLEDRLGAIETYEEVLELDPTDESAAESLELLYRSEEQWIDLEELYIDRLDRVYDPGDRRDLLVRLARLRMDRLGDFTGAEEILSELLEEEPDDDTVVEATRQLEEKLVAADEDRFDLRLRIAEMLEPVYRQRRESERLVEVLRVRLRGADDQFERLDLLDELATLHIQQIDDPEGGFELLQEAVELDPDAEGRRDQFVALGRQLQRLDGVAETLEAVAEEADPLETPRIFRRVAGLYSRELEASQDAIRCYRRVLDFDENDVDALEALEELYEQTGETERLVETLEHRARFADHDRRAELFERIGTLERHVLERPEEAIEAYETLADLEPDAIRAIEVLEELYEEQNYVVDLADILRRKSEVAVDVELQVETCLKLAELYETELQDRQEAIAVYQQVLALDSISIEALEALERLFEATEQWSDLAEILRQKLVTVEEPAVQTRVELKLADVLREELYEPESAISLYRSVLGREANRPEAVTGLEAIAEDPSLAEQVEDDLVESYRQQERWEELVALYERRCEQAGEPEQRASYHFRRAEVWRDRIGDPYEAMEAAAEAWRLDPESETYESALIELVEQQGAWDRLVEVMSEVVPEVRDPDRRADLFMLLGAVEREKLEAFLEAEEHFREVLALDETRLNAYDQIDDLLVAEGRWHDLVELLERKYEHVGSREPTETSNLLVRLAYLNENKLEDDYAAADCHERLLELEPSNELALQELARLYRSQERWDELGEHLRARLERAADADEVVELNFELAEVYRERLYRHEDAVRCYEQILDLEIGHEPTRDALEELYENEPGLGAEIAPLLERIHRFREDWTRVLGVLERRADYTEAPDEKVSIWEEAAEIASERLDDTERAFELTGHIFRLEPQREVVRASIRRLALETGRWDDLVSIYEGAIEESVPAGDPLRAELFVEQGEIFESHLESLGEARRMYGEALLEDEEFHDAIDAVERVLTRQEDWEELANFYRERARSRAEIGAVKEWLEKLARLEEVVRYDLDAAIEAFYDILDVDPDDDHARSSVQRLLAYDERWFDLADMLRDRIERAETSEERVNLKFRLAQLQEGELDDIDDAVRLYREVLRDNPDHRDTLRALEGLRRDLAMREGDWRDYRILIVEELRERYRMPEDWRRLVDLLDTRQELAQGVREKADLLVQQAALIEEGADDDVERMPALSKLGKAYCMCPGDKEFWDRFRTFAGEVDAWARVPQVLLAPLRSSDNEEHQASILVALGDVYRDHLDDPESAVVAYQQAADSDASLEALDRLEALLAEMDLWEPLVEVLERKADAAAEPSERRRLLERLGTLYDEILERPNEAVQYYEDLMAEEPDDLSYHDALESIYERTGQYYELEDLMSARLDLVDSDEERVRVLRRLATIQDEYLDEPESAIETYRSLHAENEQDHQVVDALSRLYEETKRWPELLEILRLQREFAAGLDDVNRIDFRRGQIQLEKIGDPIEAFESFKSVLERDPEFEPARDALTRLASEPETGPRASSFLQELYRAEQEWDALEALLEEQLEVVEDPERRGETYMELAQLYEEHLDNPNMAFAMLGRAFRELPGTVYIRHELDRMSAKLDNPDELLAIYQDTLEGGLEDPDVFRDLHVRTAEIAANRLDKIELAIEHADRALDYDEFDDRTLELLDRLYQQTHDWQALADVLERRLELSDADSLNDIRFRLGYLFEVMFEDYETALQYYREVIVDEPEHRGVIEGLERMVEDREYRLEIADLLESTYRRGEEWENLVDLYQLKLEVVDEPLEEASLNKKIADVQIDRLDQPELGYAFLGRSLRADPHSEAVQERLEDLAYEGERFEEIVALYEEVVETTTDPIRLVEFAEKAGRWAHRELGELERAAAMYRKVVEVEPEHEEALEGLESIARELGRNEDLADALERKAEVLFEPDEQRDVLLELGKVCTDLEFYERAADAYKQALLLDESDTEIMRQLVGLYEVTEQYEELVDVLDRLTTYEQEPETLVRLYRQIATYSRHFVDDADRAIRAYQQVLEYEPDHRDALEALEELYREEERWSDLRSILRRALEEAEKRGRDEEVTRASIELGRLSHEQFDDIDRAIDWFNRALEIESGHPGVIEALEDLYREERQWDELLDLLDEQYELAETDAKRASMLTEMARIYLRYLDEPEQANELLNRAFELDPGSQQALEVRGDIFRRRENWTGLLDVLDAKLSKADSDEQEVRIRKERGEVFENELEQPTEALREYIEILEIEPLNRVILERAGRIYEETGNLDGKYQLLEHEVRYVEEEDQEVNLLLDMAEMANHRLDDPELAADALERAYAIRPDDLEIVEPLIDAYLAVGRTDDAEPILEELIAMLEAEGREEEAARFQHQRGKLAEKRGDFEEAMRRYEAVFKKDDSFIPNLLSQGKLAYRMEQWEQAKNTFQKLLLHQMKLESDRQKVEVYYYLGLIRAQLEDNRRARDMFNRALSLDPDHEPSREALAEIEG